MGLPRGDAEAEVTLFLSNWEIHLARITMIVSLCREHSKSRLYFPASPSAFVAPVHCVLYWMSSTALSALSLTNANAAPG